MFALSEYIHRVLFWSLTIAEVLLQRAAEFEHIVHIEAHRQREKEKETERKTMSVNDILGE